MGRKTDIGDWWAAEAGGRRTRLSELDAENVDVVFAGSKKCRQFLSKFLNFALVNFIGLWQNNELDFKQIIQLGRLLVDKPCNPKCV